MNWFLSIWLYGTIISLFVVFVTTAAVRFEIRRRYKVVKKQNLCVSMIIARMLPFCVPFVNILICIISVFNYDSTLKSVIDGMIKNGEIEEKTHE